MKRVTENPDVIIKCADKGGVIAKMATNYYKNMIYEHLNDKKTYKKIENNTNNQVIRDLSKMIRRYMKQFTEFKIAKTETSNFYGLPKFMNQFY